jgi:hypothetical protein
MTPSADLQRAVDQLGAGHLRRALRSGWLAVDDALTRGDAPTVHALVDLAVAVQGVSDGRVRKQAEELEAYCRNCLDSLGGVTESHSLPSRIARIRGSRRTCPDCAEQVPAEARVCRYCGFRFEAP